MKKNMLILFTIFMLLPLNVLASEDETIEQITVPVSVDFTGERAFSINIEDNMQEFTWENNTHHADESWQVKVYRNFSWADKCPDDADTWENLTMVLGSVVDSQNKIYKLNNESHMVAREYADLREENGHLATKHEECLSDLETAQTKADGYESCVNARDSYKQDWSSCSTELKNLKEEGDSNPLIYGAIGAVIVYFLMKKKKDQPPEFEEMGGEMPGPPMKDN